jgi:hypothetical protein
VIDKNGLVTGWINLFKRVLDSSDVPFARIEITELEHLSVK